VAKAIAAEIEKVANELSGHADASLKAVGAGLKEGVSAVRSAVDWLVPAFGSNPRAAHAGAVPYLELWGLVAGGWQMGRAALVAAKHIKDGTGDARFLSAKIHTARYYADCLLPHAAGLARTITGGGDSVLAIAAEQF
jgi:3-(methylthio)propanoyl-CoA dehydrogenase